MDRFKRLAPAIVFVLLASACDDGAVSSTSQRSPVGSTARPTATTSVRSLTDTTDSPVSTTSAVVAQIGSDEAFEELVSLPLESTRIRRGIEAADVPLPNLLAADPIDAFLELLRFDLWTYQNANIEGWADVLAVEGSDAWNNYQRRFRVAAGLVAEFDSLAAFEMLEAREATDEELARVPNEILVEAGDAAVALVSIGSLAPHRLVEPNDPDSFPVSREGYVERAEIWIVVPTDAGWRFYWSNEL